MANSAFTRYGAIAMITLLAVALRSHQFLDQVLIDDEWHAVHQVMFSDVKTIVSSFGLADYSIPLTLYYKALANSIGLSELGMRAPMFVASVLMVALFTHVVWQKFDALTAILFGLLLALSPFLFYYSRIARPYGLNVFLVPICIAAYFKWWDTGRRTWFVLHAALAVSTTWLHLVVAPMVLAPHAWQLWSCVYMRSRAAQVTALKRWFVAALVVGIGLIIFVGPPFFFTPQALAEKTATDSPDWATVWGAAHQWVGSANVWITGAAVLVSALGLPSVWRSGGDFIRAYFLGLALTVVAIIIIGPAWVNNAVPFARYLLPIVPLMLLCQSVFAVRILQQTVRSIALRTIIVHIAFAGVAFVLLATGPYRDFLGRPMAYTNHSYFHSDVRPNNVVRTFMNDFPQSPVWRNEFSRERAGRLSIVLAPWALESFGAEHPLVQMAAGQRILPGSLTDLCKEWEPGTPLSSKGVRFRNFVLLNDQASLRRNNIDIVAFRKPFLINHDRACRWVDRDLTQCVSNFSGRHGPPMYEDDFVVAFDMRSLTKP